MSKLYDFYFELSGRCVVMHAAGGGRRAGGGAGTRALAAVRAFHTSHR